MIRWSSRPSASEDESRPGRFSYWPERLAEGGEVLAGGDPGDLLHEVAAGVGVEADLTWVPSEVLAEHGVGPWAGPAGLPLWLPRPEHDGMMRRDLRPSFDAGLTTRPVAETARDTLAWLREQADAPRTGLPREHEREVLAAWRARGA